LFFALFCAPACGQPLRVTRTPSLPAEKVPAALVRVAAPFGIITSTFRTVAHNRAVGGVPDSYHLLGQAVDIVRRPGVTHTRIAAALSSAGFRLIESLDEGDHSHFAFGPRTTVTPHAPPPPPAPKPAVAADEHGTLMIDLSRRP
jgi:hypothetical protein